MWHKQLLVINDDPHIYYTTNAANTVKAILINQQNLPQEPSVAAPIMLTIEFINSCLAADFYNKFLSLAPLYYDVRRQYYNGVPNDMLIVSESFASQEDIADNNDNSFHKIQINICLHKYADLYKLCCYLREDNPAIPKELSERILQHARALTDAEKYFYARLANNDIQEDLLEIAVHARNNLTILWELSQACAPYSALQTTALTNINKSSPYYQKAQIALVLCIRYQLLFMDNLSTNEYLVLIDNLSEYIKNLNGTRDVWALLEQCEAKPDLWVTVLKSIASTLALSEPNAYITYLQEQNKALQTENQQLKAERHNIQQQDLINSIHCRSDQRQQI